MFVYFRKIGRIYTVNRKTFLLNILFVFLGKMLHNTRESNTFLKNVHFILVLSVNISRIIVSKTSVFNSEAGSLKRKAVNDESSNVLLFIVTI